MLKIKDQYGVEHECTRLTMEVYFDVSKQLANNSDYKACFFIVGSNYGNDEFIVMNGLDYYEVADEFIDLKKKLVESEPTLEELLAKIDQKEVAAV